MRNKQKDWGTPPKQTPEQFLLEIVAQIAIAWGNREIRNMKYEIRNEYFLFQVGGAA